MNTELVIGTNKCCPHCEQELTPEEIKRLWSNYTTGLRQTLGGPERLRRPCQSCGMVCASAREAWSHCRVPLYMAPAELLAYVVGRIPKELAPLLDGEYASLEALDAALAALPVDKLGRNQKRQAKWFAGFVGRAIRRREKQQKLEQPEPEQPEPEQVV